MYYVKSADETSKLLKGISHLRVMLAVPMSPVVENLMPSLVAETVAVSPMLARSRTMRWYSPVQYNHDEESHI